ncbi:hypothetical protein DM56_4706 [Burkholderia mallei]|nr:hypothetical protein DM45_2910 [Burkholderia mallei]KOT11914.1 hypothetical protein DM56_4706 [Burkholderia mallei]
MPGAGPLGHGVAQRQPDQFERGRLAAVDMPGTARARKHSAPAKRAPRRTGEAARWSIRAQPGLPFAFCLLPFALPLAPCSLLPALRSSLFAPAPATRIRNPSLHLHLHLHLHLQPATCNLQPATCNLQPATCKQFSISPCAAIGFAAPC